MARYNIRDILGHWVRPKSLQHDMCPHACCRNKRVHPEHFPVILSRRMLTRATDDELADHLRRYKRDERVQRQVIREFERRDQAADRKKASAARAYSRKLDRAEYVQHEVRQAEAATKGYMVNKAGRARGISPESLFTGSEARALRYASPELLSYWQSHPRPSAGLLSANPRVVRKARARSDLGRGSFASYAGY